MRLEVTCKEPEIILEVFTPPGRRYMILQKKGHFPQDGIPLDCLPDLLALLTRYAETVNAMPFDYWCNPYERAAEKLMGQGKDFTPFFMPNTDRWAYFVLPVSQCAACHTTMSGGRFPIWAPFDLYSQLKRANWKLAGKIHSDVHNGTLCQDCEQSGVARFTCALCKQDRPYSEVKQQYGDPPEYLCKTCFQTVTAQEWDEAEDNLLSRHRYDYE